MQPANICRGRLSGICKNLTLEINHHNCNRHYYQPRVEADWSHAVWKEQEYEPYLEYLENQGNGREFHVWNHMTEGFLHDELPEIPGRKDRL